MRLSGLQNPQAARPVAPVSIARPADIPGSRLTPYPGYEIARPTRSQPPSGRFPGGGAMRLSGLQNPQAARPVAPVSTARPGNIPGWRLTPYPGYKIRRRRGPGAPVRIARPGNIPGWRLTPYPGYTLTTTIGPVARTRRPWRRLRDAARYAASAPPEGKSGCLAGGNEYTRRAPWSGALSHNSA